MYAIDQCKNFMMGTKLPAQTFAHPSTSLSIVIFKVACSFLLIATIFSQCLRYFHHLIGKIGGGQGGSQLGVT